MLALRTVARDSGLRAVVRDSPFHEYLPFLTVFGHSAEPGAVNEQVKRGDSEGKFPRGLNVRVSICAPLPLWTLALPGTCSQKVKNFPSPPLLKNQKNFTALATPFPPLSNPSHLFIRRPPARQERVWTASTGVPGDHGSAITGRGVVTGDHGADRQGRVVWRGVEGVGRGSPCDGGKVWTRFP